MVKNLGVFQVYTKVSAQPGPIKCATVIQGPELAKVTQGGHWCSKAEVEFHVFWEYQVLKAIFVAALTTPVFLLPLLFFETGLRKK